MTNPTLDQKRKALEEAFYSKEIHRAIEKVRLSKDRDTQLAEMAKRRAESDG